MSTLYRNARCDLYVGRGAGKKLLSDIREAEVSVKVVSPYLSAKLIHELIECRRRGLEVALVTMDSIPEFEATPEQNLRTMLRQVRTEDASAKADREKWKRRYKRLTGTSVVLGFLTILLMLYAQDVNMLWGFSLVVPLLLWGDSYNRKAFHCRVYGYHYVPLFPFKVVLSPWRNNMEGTFIHSKLYLIDDRIAHMGSMNFTTSGTRYNHEANIRTEDPGAISAVRFEMDQLMHHLPLPARDLQRWGSEIYPEPIHDDAPVWNPVHRPVDFARTGGHRVRAT